MISGEYLCSGFKNNVKRNIQIERNVKTKECRKGRKRDRNTEISKVKRRE
jgi:hypothetical protein